MKIFKYFVVFLFTVILANSVFAVQTNVKTNLVNSNQIVISQVDNSQETISQSENPNWISKIKNVATPSKGVLIVLAIFIPFLAVGLKTDWSISVLWNLLWCCLGVLPGIIHALIIVTK